MPLWLLNEKMAPVLEKRHPGAAGTGENNNEDEEGQNLWQVPAFLSLPHPPANVCMRWCFYVNALPLCSVATGASHVNSGPARSDARTAAALAAELTSLLLKELARSVRGV